MVYEMIYVMCSVLLLVPVQMAAESCLVPVNCEVAQWGQWSECLYACGGMLSKRGRTREVTQTAGCGGNPCSEELHEDELCKGVVCFNDGTFSEDLDTCVCADAYYGKCCKGKTSDLVKGKLIGSAIVMVLCLCCVGLSLIACRAGKKKLLPNVPPDTRETQATQEPQPEPNLFAEMFQITTQT